MEQDDRQLAEGLSLVLDELAPAARGIGLVTCDDPHILDLASTRFRPYPVTVKVMAHATLGEADQQGFRSRCGLMASLTRASICKLFEADVTDQGHPYFVTERVDGQPIDAYCDDHCLDIDARLRLLVPVCEAVAHAHVRGLAHGNIERSNIVVTQSGGVRLRDFGITGLVQGRRADAVEDVYALGALLYLILTGLQPAESREHAQTRSRAIRRPSECFRTRLGVSCDGAASELAARARGLSEPALARRLRGDLDAIVLMALRKDPARRYPDAADLGDDLRRHLNHFPIRARADRRVSRAARFLKRRGLAAQVATAALVTVTVAVGSTLYRSSSNAGASEKATTQAAVNTAADRFNGPCPVATTAAAMRGGWGCTAARLQLWLAQRALRESLAAGLAPRGNIQLSSGGMGR